MSNLIGQTIGGYRIIEQIGLGGMATVYKAYQSSMDRYVAFKVMSTHLAQNPSFVQRFQHEAKLIAKLEHSHILPVYDHGEEDGYLYLVMRLVEGGTLADWLQHGSLSLDDARRVVNQIGLALEYAHQQGVIHRDFKPSNILIDAQGDCYLADFGIAKLVEGTLGLTGSSVLGTPHYMAPEQGKGLQIDHRADIYAMGVVIYRMVLGQVPFDAETPYAVVMKHLTEPLPLPRSVNPSLPEPVERVILKALAKQPGDRYQSMADLVAAFDQAVQWAKSGEEPTVASFWRNGAVAEEIRADPTALSQPAAIQAGRAWLLQQSPWWLVVVAAVLFAVVLIWGVASRTGYGVHVGSVQNPPDENTFATQVAATLRADQTAQAQALIPTPTATVLPSPTPTPTSTATPSPIPTFTPSSTLEPDAVVSAGGSDVRAGPGTGYEVISQAGQGELLQVTGRNTSGDWLEVMKPDGSRGWISILHLRVNVVLDEVPLASIPPTATPTPSATPKPTPVRTPTPTATVPTPTPQPALEGKLAFSLRQYINSKSYVVKMGPTPSTELYASIGDARQPALSHDGQWLLVNGTGSGIDAIARMTSDGHQATAVTCLQTTAESGRPIWSPDDRLIAFDGLGVDRANPQIYIHRIDQMDCDLGDNRLLVNGGLAADANGLFPLWGPDDRIYFRSCSTWEPGGAGACGIWSVERDGSDLLQLTDHVQHLPTAVNRERLLFMFNNNGDWDVYSVGVEGGAPQNLTAGQTSVDAWGTLSPDGRTIAFLSNRLGRWAIWLMEVNGSNPREWLQLDPAWGEVDMNRIGEERMSWSR